MEEKRGERIGDDREDKRGEEDIGNESGGEGSQVEYCFTPDGFL